MQKKMFIAGVLVCLLFTACGSTNAGNNAKNTEEGQSIVAKDDQTQESEDISTEKEEDSTKSDTEAEEQDADTAYNIGDSATLGDWEITVTDAKFVESIAGGYGTFSPKTEESKYVQIFLKVTNNGKQADNFLPSFSFGDDVYAKVLYGDGYEFSSTNLLGYSNEIHDSTINPLSSKEGELVFDVPNSVTDAEDELLVKFSSGNDSIIFKIR